MPAQEPYKPIYDAVIAIEWNYNEEMGKYNAARPATTYRIDVARIDTAVNDAIAVADAFCAANPSSLNNWGPYNFGAGFRAACKDFKAKLAPLMGPSASNVTIRDNLMTCYNQYIKSYASRAHEKERTGAVRV